MTTAAEAYAEVKARLEGPGAGISIPLRWQGEDQTPLPDTPTAFAFVTFENLGSGRGPSEFGGGSGNNRYRNSASVVAYVFTPRGPGLQLALQNAETIAARLRSYRSAGISCSSADVIPVGDGSGIKPPGLDSDVNNYQCAIAEIDLWFDQIG